MLAGIRPKDIYILPADAGEISTPAQVRHVQVLGETSILNLNVNGDELRVKLPTQSSPSRGEQVRLTFEIDDCHFFDPQTENRLSKLIETSLE